MIFCPKCGSILKPKVEREKKVLSCSCGFKNKDEAEIKIKEAGKENKKLEVVDEEEISVYPKVKEECPKCENKEAYTWEIQTRAGDEPATKFYKCTKCKHTWRDYG